MQQQEQINKSTESFERYKERISSFSNEFELGLFLFIAKRNLILTIFLGILGFALAKIYLRYKTPTYEAGCVIQIKNEENANKYLNLNNAAAESGQGIYEWIELLKSPIFFKRVLLKLPLEISYYAVGTFQENEQYQSSNYKVEFKNISPELKDEKIWISFHERLKGTISFTIKNKTYSTEFKPNSFVDVGFGLIKITNVNFYAINLQQEKTKLYFTINNIETLLSNYHSNLEAREYNASAKTIRISFKDFNARKTAEVVNLVAEEFGIYDKERKGAGNQGIIDFINSQIVIVYGNLTDAENNIRDFQLRSRASVNTDLANASVNRYSEMEMQSLSAEIQINAIENILNKLKTSNSIDTYTLVSILASVNIKSQTITEIIKEIQRLILMKQGALYAITPNNPSIDNVDFQIEIQKKLLIESINNYKKQLEFDRLQYLQRSNEIENNFRDLPISKIELSKMQRNFTINEKYYNMLLEKRTEYSITMAGYVSRSIMLEPAYTPSSPLSPVRIVIISAFTIIGLLFGLLIILIKYIIHNEVNSLNEITKGTQSSISTLGIVPKYSKDIPVSQLLVDKNPKSLIAESFRSIRTNLQFISNTPGPKTIALTSTISGEGKTFVAINLAGIIAYSGKKVIIIDLDMRKPKIHKGFQAENHKGMSSLLIGRDKLEECIQKSQLEGLDFITAGPVPPNPSELILSPDMDKIVEKLKTMYDIVMIDNPPVGLVTDGIEMIKKADYPIYIFRADYSKRNFIHNLDRLYNESGIKKLSVILNGVDIERNIYGYNYGYGYGYGYGGYGYGYGYYDDSAKKMKKQSLFSRIFKKKEAA